MGGEANFEIKYSENMFKVPDATAAIRDYASQGFNLVSRTDRSTARRSKKSPRNSPRWRLPGAPT